MVIQTGNVKTYRTNATLVLGLAAACVFLLVGVSGLIPANHAGPSGMIIAGISVAFSIWLAALIITNGLTVTREYIVYRNNFRKRTIPWSSVRSFDIGKSQSVVRWPCLVINTDSGQVRVDSIAGTRSFVDRVACELRSFTASLVGSSWTVGTAVNARIFK